MVEQSFTALSLKQTFHRTTPVPGRDPPLSLPRPSSAHLTSPHLASPRLGAPAATQLVEEREETKGGRAAKVGETRGAEPDAKESKAKRGALAFAGLWPGLTA